ncbi:hypothetical protein LINPERHAP1_LOCUS10642 [Linum perenne]
MDETMQSTKFNRLDDSANPFVISTPWSGRRDSILSNLQAPMVKLTCKNSRTIKNSEMPRKHAKRLGSDNPMVKLLENLTTS